MFSIREQEVDAGRLKLAVGESKVDDTTSILKSILNLQMLSVFYDFGILQISTAQIKEKITYRK